MKLYEIFLNGGPVMWPLLGCSLVVLTVIGERILFWQQLRRQRNRPLMDDILHLAETGDWQAVRATSAGCEDHVIRMLNVGILHRQYDMGKAMEAEAQHMRTRMLRFMTVLDTMITITPLLGILGTVIGIIASFEILGTGNLADPKLVTAGIAQALITTATGLATSITTVFPYNYFKSRIEQAVYTMEKYGTSLEVVYARLEDGGGDNEA